MSTGRAEFGPDRTIVWLASYPKSGNTWLRAMLTAYLLPDRPLDLNAMVGATQVLDRQLLDDLTGISSSELTPEETIPYQAMLFREIARDNDPPLFAKTHWASVHDGDGNPVFPADATAGAIHIVRDPFDIVPSLSHHEEKDLDRTLELMSDEAWSLDHWPDKRSTSLPQIVGSWSTHTASWLDEATFPVLRLRFEDMLGDPSAALRSVLEFSGIAPEGYRVDAALAATQFDSLRKREAKQGFAEKPSSTRSFFRSGRSGEGREILNEEQAARLLRDHGAIMQRLGYTAATAREEN